MELRLRNIVNQLLMADDDLTILLAKYDGEPAIFYRKVPDEGASGWVSVHHPYLVYAIDMGMDKGKEGAGRLTIWIGCLEADSNILPDEIGVRIQLCLNEVFLRPGLESPYALQWRKTRRTHPRDWEIEPPVNAYGSRMVYDILEFPSHQAFEPDPVTAVRRHVKTYFSGMEIGEMEGDGFYRQSSQKPAFYLKVEERVSKENGNTIVYQEVTMRIFVFAATREERYKHSIHLFKILTQTGEVAMLDGSPMQILAVQVTDPVDYLAEGQIKMTARFGEVKYLAKDRLVRFLGISSSFK